MAQHVAVRSDSLPAVRRLLTAWPVFGRCLDLTPVIRAVPVVGQAPAGPLMLAEENLEGWVSMNKTRVGSERIEDDDLVLVRQQAATDDGATIAPSWSTRTFGCKMSSVASERMASFGISGTEVRAVSLLAAVTRRRRRQFAAHLLITG